MEDSVIRDVAASNSMTMVRDVGGHTRRMYRSLWDGLARSMSPENVALIEELAAIGRSLFPLQMSIFDNLSRLTGETNPSGTRPYARPYTEDEYRRILEGISAPQEYLTVVQPQEHTPSSAAASTGDSWQTQVPQEEAAGEEGWQLRAIDDVRELYRCDVTEEIPAMEHLKTCLCKAKQAAITADEQVQQLTSVRANAMSQRNKGRKILGSYLGAPAMVNSALAAGKALEDLVKATNDRLTEAAGEASKAKQHLYVLQQGWTRAVGLTSSIVPLCNICLLRGVKVVCVPCGHTYCAQCAAGLGKQPNASRYTPPAPCHVCRSTVRVKQKLFFS